MKLRELLDSISEVAIRLNTSTPMIVGGTARDKYLNNLNNIDDLDLTNGDSSIHTLASGVAKKLSDQYNIKEKVMEDGHSSIFMGGVKVDFSSNYVVPNIDKYLLQYKISKPTNIQREMFSRDFTCNAVLLDFDLKKMHSPVKTSFEDLNNKILKTCLSPEITLTNSKNRVCRAVYLSSKLGFDIDKGIINFVKQNPNSLNIGNKKTINEKLNKAFDKDPERAAWNISQMGLWQHIPINDKILPYYTKHIREGL